MNSLKSKGLKSWFNEKIVIIKLVKLQYTINDDRSSRSEKESLKSFQVGGSKCGVNRKKHINKEWQFFTVYIHRYIYSDKARMQVLKNHFQNELIKIVFNLKTASACR